MSFILAAFIPISEKVSPKIKDVCYYLILMPPLYYYDDFVVTLTQYLYILI